MSGILCTMKEIRRLTGFHPATIYRKIKKNEFPEPIKINWGYKRGYQTHGKSLAYSKIKDLSQSCC